MRGKQKKTYTVAAQLVISECNIVSNITIILIKVVLIKLREIGRLIPHTTTGQQHNNSVKVNDDKKAISILSPREVLA